MRDSNHIYDIIIIGGGLAGLCSAIHLSKSGFQVLLIEKNSYPKHKVCGEYISNEVIPYLEFLGVNVFNEGAKRISKFELTTLDNKKIKAELPLGGFGMSRYKLDALLAEKAISQKSKIIQDLVISIEFLEDVFKVSTKNADDFRSKIVIGAFGKRSNLDVELERTFIKNPSPYLAVKRHVNGKFPSDLVALHNFEGGYCGVSTVESDQINLCYITDYKTFKKYKDIDAFEKDVVFKNAELEHIFKTTESVFETPLTISQISFDTKKAVENHMLMCGDSAGMIHPLCGNGMGMAIRSAQIASLLIIDYLQGKIASRRQLELRYQKQWDRTFKSRLATGHLVAAMFRSHYLAEKLIWLLQKFPKLLPSIIKRTHGSLMTIK